MISNNIDCILFRHNNPQDMKLPAAWKPSNTIRSRSRINYINEWRISSFIMHIIRRIVQLHKSIN